MKIEKISDTQIKFVLTKNDLESRDIRIDDLAGYTDKTITLFREIMEQAAQECNFQPENAPLMVEAVPVPYDGIMIIVTKMENTAGVKIQDDKFGIAKQVKEMNRFRRKPITNYQYERNATSSDTSVFYVENIEEVIALCRDLGVAFEGKSALYKMRGRYYLAITPKDEEFLKSEWFDALLSEYDAKETSSEMSQYYLAEHGEKIVAENAVSLICGGFSEQNKSARGE